MAKTKYAIEYLGAEILKASTSYTSDDIITKYPTANMMKIKTKGVNVGVNGSSLFPIEFDDETIIVIGHNYIFDKECTVAIGKYHIIN